MELSGLKGIGPVTLSRLQTAGIYSLHDLLYTLPYKYEDQSVITSSGHLKEGIAMVQGIIREKPKISYYHGLSKVTALLEDKEGFVHLCWFNEPWMVTQLPLNEPVMLYGTIRQKNRSLILQNSQIVRKAGWVAVYHAIQGIPARSFRKIIQEALQHQKEACPETLPASFRLRHNLCDLPFALQQIHSPDGTEELRIANRRFSFENMLMYLMRVVSLRNSGLPGFKFSDCFEQSDAYWRITSFSPTSAQRKVLYEIATDFEKKTAMCRLVQGDVGCGKTAIAFGAIFLCCQNHFQAAMMAPTEILAQQHFENAVKILQPQGIHCRLLTGNTRSSERKMVLNELLRGECNVVFGTHALLSEKVNFQKLGLVITDEQHRFGVRQRSKLQEKGVGQECMPHVLVMSATPIPRTLALILYGDLDLSVVDELPPGRKPVKTRLVSESRREDMYKYLKQQIFEGRQAYIVCPLVEDSEQLDQVHSAKTVYMELSSGSLKNMRVALTWGNQKSDEKAKVIKDFSEGKIDVLVSTTVIEVGVNVPNATIMIIENAERYGLSQLHQLRGRVGRGDAESWCFLLSGENNKLHILCETNDGFLVAQKDLELRGPGDLMGIRQSGELINGISASGDARLLDEVNNAVKELFRSSSLLAEKMQIQQLAESFFSEHDNHVALN